MPRRPRDIAPGCHHVWVSATGGSEYFVDAIDRVAWVRSLVRVLNRLGWTCPAFCQMSTHVHLLVSTPDQSLPLGMRDLNRQYSYATSATIALELSSGSGTAAGASRAVRIS
jgi:REP element-mobilizing transposase RayT